MKKQFFVLGAIFIALAAFYLLASRDEPARVPAPSGSFVQELPASSSPRVEAPVATESASLALLKVDGTFYTIPAGPGETVIAAMDALAALGGFTYTSKDFPGLGVFVDSINGKKGGGGMYWILYVNGEAAAKGAGLIEMHEGDIIEWKYEKGY